MAKVHDLLEMWQGSQNLHATQQESRAENKQMTTVGYISDTEEIVKASCISNKPSFCQEHPGVYDGPVGFDRTSYSLTENQTRPVAHATGCVAYRSCGGFYTMPLILVALYITLATVESGFLYFASGMG
jgi:hypothetical protein